MDTKKLFYGLLRKKECLRPTIRGWILILFAIILFNTVLFIRIHPFLAPVKLVNSNIMIVEGWLPNYVLEKVAKDFQSKRYRLIITTGGSITPGSKVLHTFATDAAAKLIRLGVSSEVVVAVSAPDVSRDRTYSSALSVWDWLKNTHLEIKAVNLYSVGAHGRRSWMLYKMAFPSKVKVGIVSVPNNSYDPLHWWESSNGVKAIIEEFVTYLYARLLFHPKN
ncbi:MAG: hypothetical protein A2Y40_07285 [Candidatus Margulisbacteria bacterium GWF2_35_9]|nr:MAG: hypothetical protein A2Y40_07285 [Candidatus Margulisbacteria bacterium GWF2_35_9]